MRIGYHVRIAGGLVKAAERAAQMGCECMQIFPRNPRGWKSRDYPEAEVTAFREARERLGLRPLVLHSNYLVNLAASNPTLLAQSRTVVADDLRRAGVLGAEFVVTHSGNPVGESVEVGLARIVESLKFLLPQVPKGVRFLLENTAGAEERVGSQWEHFAFVFKQLKQDPRLGICFDTCHAHAAGYRMDGPRQVAATLRGFDAAVGLDRLALIHLNDCQSAPGGHLDRHEHIGCGTIGDAGLRALLLRRDLKDRAAILETPIREPGDDARNLAHVRELIASHR